MYIKIYKREDTNEDITYYPIIIITYIVASWYSFAMHSTHSCAFKKEA